MHATERRRVIVGLDGSLPGLRALRQALAEARQRAAELHVVHVRPPARPDHYALGLSTEAPPTDEWMDRQAEEFIATRLEEGLGGVPSDVPVYRTVIVGKPGRALARMAWRDDDLLVVGTRRRGRLRRLLRRSTSRYLIAHADCPVLVVPPDSFARAVRGRTRLGARLLRRDPWKQFEAATTANHQHAR